MKRKLAVFLSMLTLVLLVPAVNVKAETTGLDVTAPAAVLMDYATGQVLFEKNSHEQRPCASITKVMTLCLTFEQIEAGNLQLTDTLSASAHAASMGGSDIWLKEGEMMTVDDLIKATVIMSANDAAVVLAEAVSGSEDAFVARMNEKAAELGMADTTFKNCNGLDEEGHVTSAYDVALMSRELMKYDQVYEYTTTWIDYLRDGATQLVNTNKLIKTYNGIKGLKTGTTSKAGSCITACAERNGLTLISVILGAANTDDRFRDAASLMDFGFANWIIETPETPELTEINVERGMEKAVGLESQGAPAVLLNATAKGSVTSEITIWENIEAPIAKGDILGKISYYSGDKLVAEMDITAAVDVEKISFSSVFMYLLRVLMNP